jgi:hypothetical protein
MRGRGLRWCGIGALLVALACTVVLAPGADAQSRKSTRSTAKAPSLSSQINEQKRRIDTQQALIDSQRVMIETGNAEADSQAVLLSIQAARIAALDSALVIMKRRLETLESQANFPVWEDSLELRIRQVEAATQKSPELPPDVVSAGDFPGSIRIPGTDAAIKFGGRIRTAVVLTLDPLGTDDRFLTNSIPVGVPDTIGEATRTNISARASRLNIEFRTPTGAEQVRAFFEGDFAGEVSSTSGGVVNAFRLRHSYAQYRGFIVGQTWSTFSDPWVELEDLDFEGVSSENVIRQPQIRYWWTEGKHRIAVAIETPRVSLTGGTGVNLIPDVIARDFIQFAGGGHLQVAAVARQIRGESTPGETRSTWGLGSSVTGVVNVPIKTLTDRFMFQINGGSGSARYINDLNSLGGQDGVFDPATGDLQALEALGWYVGYEHQWKEWTRFKSMNLRSTALWSLVTVDNVAFQPDNAYKRTNRLALNLVFSPSGRVDVGLEYIYGTRENKDGQNEHANQVQAVGLFRF